MPNVFEYVVTENEENEINDLGYFYAYDLGITRTSIWIILHKHNMHAVAVGEKVHWDSAVRRYSPLYAWLQS